ncbi:MAG TPA: hypothetical protein V6D00_14105 [Pantanalinema sp.]
MHRSFRLAAIALTALLVGCPSPSTTQTNNNTNPSTSTEVKKTVTGKITRNGMANPKVLLVTVEGDTVADAAAAFLSLPGSTESDRYPGVTAVKPGTDDTYSTEIKLGSKVYTYGMLLCWNDANDDGKYSDNEVSGGSAKAHNGQPKVDLVLSKTEYKEYVGTDASDVKTAYDWAFPEIKQTVNLKMANMATNGKFAFLTVEGNSDLELKNAIETLSNTVDGIVAPSAVVAVPVAASHSLEIKLDKKPYKAVTIMGWNDANDDGKIQLTELDSSKATVVNSDNFIALRLSSLQPDNLKVLASDGTASVNADVEYTWTFTLPD